MYLSNPHRYILEATQGQFLSWVSSFWMNSTNTSATCRMRHKVNFSAECPLFEWIQPIRPPRAGCDTRSISQLSVLFLNEFNQYVRHVQDATQGQFLNWVSSFWMNSTNTSATCRMRHKVNFSAECPLFVWIQPILPPRAGCDTRSISQLGVIFLYEFNQYFRHVQDATQGQFLNWVSSFWMNSTNTSATCRMRHKVNFLAECHLFVWIKPILLPRAGCDTRSISHLSILFLYEFNQYFRHVQDATQGEFLSWVSSFCMNSPKTSATCKRRRRVNFLKQSTTVFKSVFLFWNRLPHRG